MTSETASMYPFFKAWFWGMVIIAGFITLFVLPFITTTSSWHTNVETYADTDCLTKPISKMQPRDDSVCSTVDENVVSYKFTQIGFQCQVWLYDTNDTTCSLITPVPLLQSQFCIPAASHNHFLVHCQNPIQPYRGPNPSITTTEKFKVGLAYGIPLGLYSLIFIMTIVCGVTIGTINICRSCVAARRKRAKEARGPLNGDVPLQPTKNERNSRAQQLTTAGAGPNSASKSLKMNSTIDNSQAEAQHWDRDEDSATASLLPPYEPNDAISTYEMAPTEQSPTAETPFKHDTATTLDYLH